MEQIKNNSVLVYESPKDMDDFERSEAQLEAARNRAKSLIADNRVMIEALKSYGLGLTEELDLSTFIGPVAVYLQETEATNLRDRLFRWSTYFTQNIDDITVFSDSIENGILTDPSTMFDVVAMTETLLRAAAGVIKK